MHDDQSCVAGETPKTFSGFAAQVRESESDRTCGTRAHCGRILQ